MSKLNVDFNEVVVVKDNLEASLASERQTGQEAGQVALNEKRKLVEELELLRQNLENTEQILAERTNNRDEYMAKLAILEEQLNEAQEKIATAGSLLSEAEAKESDVGRRARAVSEQLEQERRGREELAAGYEQTQALMNQNLGQLKAENEGLNGQISVLQAELGKMGQDLVILQQQDTFRSR